MWIGFVLYRVENNRSFEIKYISWTYAIVGLQPYWDDVSSGENTLEEVESIRCCIDVVSLVCAQLLSGLPSLFKMLPTWSHDPGSLFRHRNGFSPGRFLANGFQSVPIGSRKFRLEAVRAVPDFLGFRKTDWSTWGHRDDRHDSSNRSRPTLIDFDI